MSMPTLLPSQVRSNESPARAGAGADTNHSPPLSDRALKKPRLNADEEEEDGEDHDMEGMEQQQPPVVPQQGAMQPVPQAGAYPPAFPQPGAALPVRVLPTEDLPQPLTRHVFNANTMPYVDDFDDETQAVAARGENPHLLSTRSGGAVELPLPPHPPFPDTDFVHTHIAAHRLLANMLAAQAAAAKAEGVRVIAIVTHGGGQLMYKKAPEVAGAVQNYLRGFAFQSNNNEGFDVKVYTPIPNKEEPGKPFAPPFAMLARLPQGADVLRTFLLQQEVFAISPTLSFTALSLDNAQASWKILTLTSDAIVAGATHRYVVEQKQALLAAIKQTLEGREVAALFENLTVQLVRANWGLTGTRRAIVDAALDTFSLELSSAEDAKGAVIPAYILLAKPPAYEQSELDAWKTIVAGSKSFWIGMDRFDINAARVDCKLCKSDVHRTGDCPIATTDGWPGVTPEALALPEATQAEAGRSDDANNDAAFDLTMREMFRSLNKRPQRGGRNTARGGRGGRGSRGGRAGRGGRGGSSAGAWM